jgi:uncharacterized protein DUF5056
MDDFNQEDILDRRLREAAPYINDDGFTARVLKQLPSHPATMRVRGVILVGVTILACVLTYFLSNGGRFVAESFVRLAGLPLLWLLLVTFCSGILVSSLGLVAAVSKLRQPS